jgi:hypothetical protein
MYGQRFLRDFGDSPPEPWISACGALKDHEIKRGLARLANTGSGSSPTLPQFVKACRTVGEDDGPKGPRGTRESLPPPQHQEQWHRWGQLALLKFLVKYGPAPDHQLPAMIAAKNRLVASYRLIASEEDVTAQEFTAAMHAELAKVRRERLAA